MTKLKTKKPESHREVDISIVDWWLAIDFDTCWTGGETKR
jgi:hypothetical protein